MGNDSPNPEPRIKPWSLPRQINPDSFGPTGENFRASTLIHALQNLMAVHGDLKIGIFNPEYASFEACDRVFLKEAEHSSFGDGDELEGPFFAVE